ncbi:MAG: hypothetical protein ABSD41_10235 [Candidatus Bathyarchaeia archaeon]
MTLQVARPRERVIDVLYAIAHYLERKEEDARRSRMPTEKLTPEEINELDEASREMDEKGMSLTLAEFNQDFNSEIRRKNKF